MLMADPSGQSSPYGRADHEYPLALSSIGFHGLKLNCSVVEEENNQEIIWAGILLCRLRQAKCWPLLSWAN